MAEPSLYERLGGVFAIAAVIDHFSDAVVQNPGSAPIPVDS
jgi:hemoglobin